MIGLPFVYGLAGLAFAAFAISSGAGRQWANAAFYTLIALSFLAGDRLGDAGNGLLVVALVALGGSGTLRRTARGTSPERLRGNALFLPALIVPVVALLGTLMAKQFPALVDPKQATLVAVVAGAVIALLAGMAWLRPHIGVPFVEGRRVMDDVGWAAILPQMLASLGVVFALAGVGDAVGQVLGHVVPSGSLLGAVLVYGIGMTLFTMVMGNAFAAFPVMAAAIGVPVLVRGFGGDPAPIAAVGMLAGFCGTLMTPMAANFNLLPATLLGLNDRFGVIRAQAPTALPMLAFNIALLYLVLR